MLRFKEEFNSIEAVKERIYSFKYGKVNEVSFGPHTFIISSTEHPEHLFYSSETDDKSYNYTIEIYSNLYILYVYSFHKNKMINAAENGDLEMFIENFTNSAKMKEFALSTAISSDNWNIVNYLLSNYHINKNPLWDAIRYNRVVILNNLIEIQIELPKNWLAYCMYCDSYEVTKELLCKRKKHLDYSNDELKTNWFDREIFKDKKTAKFVNSII